MQVFYCWHELPLPAIVWQGYAEADFVMVGHTQQGAPFVWRRLTGSARGSVSTSRSSNRTCGFTAAVIPGERSNGEVGWTAKLPIC
jgi:hypothetical protein